MEKKNKSFSEDHIEGFSVLKFRELLTTSIAALVFLSGVVFGFYEFMKSETKQQSVNQNSIVQHKEKIKHQAQLIEAIKTTQLLKVDKWVLNQHVVQDQREKDLLWNAIQKP